MAISLAPQFTQRPCSWTAWKALRNSKNGVHQYEEEASCYTVWFYDTPEVILCTIWKDAVPHSVVAGGYSQEQNDLDKADFEGNYKGSSNQTVQKKATDGTPVMYVSSGVQASSVLNQFVEQSSGTDKADLRVNGSSTSVDFVFSADANNDLVINSLGFVIVASSITSGSSRFAGMGKLTNGVSVIYSTGNVEYSLGVIRENEDFIHFSSSGGYNFWAINKDQVISQYNTCGGIILTHGTTDKVIVRVRDNLSSGLDYFKCMVKSAKRG